MTVKLIIRRFDPTRPSSACTQTYRIPVSPAEKWTVMDLLDYVQQNLDSSLRYYRHSICNRGICKRCLARINGRLKRLCEHVVTSGDDIRLEPATEQSVVIDLVTR